MQYAWMTCQKVSQVILPHNLLVPASVRVCPCAYTQSITIVEKTQPEVEAGQEPLSFLCTRGKWTQCIPATSSSDAGKQVVEEQGLKEMEVLEDEEFQHTLKDQRGDTKYTYKVSVGILQNSCCVFSYMWLCR